jgi:hypothetical protein
MNQIKKARRLIETNPESGAAEILANLVRALESDEKFALADLYDLSYEDFEIAIGILKEWRLERYYASKAKLHDMSVQMASMVRN